MLQTCCRLALVIYALLYTLALTDVFSEFMRTRFERATARRWQRLCWRWLATSWAARRARPSSNMAMQLRRMHKRLASRGRREVVCIPICGSSRRRSRRWKPRARCRLAVRIH